MEPFVHTTSSDATTPLSATAGTLLGLGHMALRGAEQITELVAEMHETIARTPLPIDRSQPDARRAPLPYRMVSSSFAHLADLLARSALLLSEEPSDPPGDDSRLWLRAVLNGVMGDKLARWKSPLALQMGFHDRHGRRLDPQQIGSKPAQQVTIVLHGLCMHDRGWMNPAHLAFADALEERGHQLVWLRYNSGLPVGENGRLLAGQLANLSGLQEQTLHLVGHSMGGLLIRSACHYAERSQQPWLSALQSCSYLSTPHQGAPYERLGHLVNSIGGVSPYTRPFMRLGNIRSAAIRDLRFGNIFEEARPGDWDISQRDQRPPLPALVPHARHLLLGGGRTPQAAAGWQGDGLVPVASALGLHDDPERAIRGEQIIRCELPDLDHIAMLCEPRIYQRVLDCIEPPSLQRA